MMEFFGSGRRRLGLVAAVAVLSFGLGGCSVFSAKKAPPPCPEINVLADAAKFTQFRPGQGRDITDQILSGEITGYKGSCSYDKDTKKLTVTLQVQMTFTKGPAAPNNSAKAQYFVAVPAFFPKPAAKQILGVQFAFAANADHVQITDNEVQVVLPVADFGKDLPNREVYVGFQLDQDELDYNRRNQAK
jgi:hypothetical protein